MLTGKNILLVISGGIAAYKTPDMVRKLKSAGADVTCVLTQSATKFVTELSLQSVSGNRVYTDIFSLDDEHEMGHIRLARDADLVLVAPATANMIAKMAHGEADNMATTLLLATTKPVMVAPAMNWAMWENQATIDNVSTLSRRGIGIIGPDVGELACGEEGQGRMSDLDEIINAISERLDGTGPLSGVKAIVTSGPTIEPIDPVRYIANRSSGKQGHAIAKALSHLGAKVTLISGPTAETAPEGVDVINITTAKEMLAACENALPADVFVGAAAVSDWRATDEAKQKIKKGDGPIAELSLTENPDILKTMATLSSKGQPRPRLVIGFAAETENVVENARRKLAAKGCDWILANDVSSGSDTFGGDENQVHFVTRSGVKEWPRLNKNVLAEKLAVRIASALSENSGKKASNDEGR